MYEHIDEMGMINMNRRIYEPLIGRFMSADPYIQAPDDLQSHNRYAYVMNNPLNLTDPSGFSWLSKTWKKVWKSPIFKAMVGIVVAIYAPALLQTFFGLTAGGLGSAIATGALSGFASTGTLKGALTGAFTAGIMFGAGEIAHTLKEAGVGGFDAGGIGKVALHAAAGCVTSVAGGGDCKSGALSGAVGELGNNLPSGGREFNTVKAALLGGVGSRISGGKFADGAITGAFGYLFNEASKHGDLLKSKNTLEKISDALDIKKNFEEGYQAGKEYKEQVAKDEKIYQDRINSNPDDTQRQNSAKGFKAFSTGMAGPGDFLLESIGDVKNPIVVIPKTAGFIKSILDN